MIREICHVLMDEGNVVELKVEHWPLRVITAWTIQSQLHQILVYDVIWFMINPIKQTDLWSSHPERTLMFHWIFQVKMAAKLPSFDELLQETLKSFEEIFKTKANVAACAPGRVNLIGEHIDYCDGFVLPMVSTSLLCWDLCWLLRRWSACCRWFFN